MISLIGEQASPDFFILFYFLWHSHVGFQSCLPLRKKEEGDYKGRRKQKVTLGVLQQIELADFIPTLWNTVSVKYDTDWRVIVLIGTWPMVFWNAVRIAL